MLHNISLFDAFFLTMIVGTGLPTMVWAARSFYRSEVLPHKKMPMAKMNKRR